jgi:hypothetical protein
MAEDFWSADLAAARAGRGDKTSLERRGKLASIASSQQGVLSSQQSEAASRAAEARARAEFILKYGVPPEDITPTHTVPGDTTKTGEDYLQTLDPSLARQVKMLAEGRRAFPTGAALRNPAAMQLLAAATQYDPQLDAANAATRVATRKDFTSGMSARNLTALNTAVGHLATLKTLANELNNTTFPTVNAAVNYLQSEQLGDPRVRKYKTAAMAFAGELAKVFKGTGAPSLTELKDWEEQLDENMSPAQFQGFVTTAADLLNSRINAVGDTYNRGMNTSAQPITLLSPHARELYEKLEAPAATETQGVADATPGGKQVAGEDVKGFRFTPEHEAAISDYIKSAKATPEGYGNLVSSYAIAEKHISPEQYNDYATANAAATQDFFKAPPEVRARVAPVSYEDVDKAATENAGLGDSVAQTFRNMPESSYNLATGALAPVTDLMRSIGAGERQGLYKAVPDILGDVTGLSDTGTANAFGAALAEKYGSMAGLKRSLITDPMGTAGDVSLPLTLGGGLLARAPGVLGSTGRTAATAGRIIDPFSGLMAAATQGVPAAVAAIPEGLRRGAGEAATEAAGLSSGVGGATMREGYAAGRSRGLAGAPTPQSEAFTGSMRGTSAVGKVVDVARDAVANLRDAATRQYKAAMAQFGQTPTPLSPDALRATMAANKPKNFDVMADAPHRPSDHLAWQQMNDTVEHYLAKAQADPTLLEPLAVDQFKQDLYTVGSKVGGAADRDAARIAGGAYRAVRKMLTDHDPIYGKIMKDYGDAAEEAASLESGFSLTSRRGKPVNVDAASRRLQSIMRNNASTNYGQRAAMGERLAELDPTGTIMPTLAGQSASSWVPRGLRANVEGAGLLTGALHGGLGALVSPSLWAGLATTSPRVAGEVAGGLGRAAGAAERVIAPRVSDAYDLYNRYPAVPLGISRADQYADETERERLLREYGPGGLSLSAPSEMR